MVSPCFSAPGDRPHVLAIADHAVLLLDEQRHWVGSTDSVMTPPTLRELYGIDMKMMSVEHGGATVQIAAPIFPSQSRKWPTAIVKP